MFCFVLAIIVFLLTNRDSKTWSTSGIDGVHRFLARVWRLVVGSPSVDGKFKVGTVDLTEEPSMEQLRSLHRCINKVIMFILRFCFLFIITFQMVSAFLSSKL